MSCNVHSRTIICKTTNPRQKSDREKIDPLRLSAHPEVTAWAPVSLHVSMQHVAVRHRKDLAHFVVRATIVRPTQAHYLRLCQFRFDCVLVHEGRMRYFPQQNDQTSTVSDEDKQPTYGNFEMPASHDISFPFSSTVQESGAIRPARIFRSVLFPAPFSP